HFREAHVTWLVDEKALPLLEGNPHIDRLLTYDLTSVLQLQRERFDTVVNFEKVPGVCALADSVQAWRRFGFRFDEETGEAKAYDRCEQAFTLCCDRDAKKNHAEPWQKILLESIGAEWNEQPYILGYRPRSAEQFDIGLNHAVGSKWPTKAWPTEYWTALEQELLERGQTLSWQQGFDDLYDYIEWIQSCRTIITGDSLGLHIALALGKNVVVLYGPTNSNETFLYGRGIGIYPQGYDCAPCFSPECTHRLHCLRTISPKRVAQTALLWTESASLV
ncbi:MAG: glycosyltransferase family 9 protein, partial [Planctomycetes bacterium]|nr:glycosyltransferase family 9 protein [Planctomycetota bacterium]